MGAGRPSPLSPPCSEITEFLQQALGRCIVLHYRPSLIEDQNPSRVVDDLAVIRLLLEGSCSEPCIHLMEEEPPKTAGAPRFLQRKRQWSM